MMDFYVAGEEAFLNATRVLVIYIQNKMVQLPIVLINFQFFFFLKF